MTIRTELKVGDISLICQRAKAMELKRTWAMPNRNTFEVKPIGDFVKKYLAASVNSCDPFARNNTWAVHTNDIDPNTSAQHHMDAIEFLSLSENRYDLIILDPPYSPRQISECYKSIDRTVSMSDTQNAKFNKQVKDAAYRALIDTDGIVLSFGWNSSGMGISRGFKILEIMLCSHGGAHNDTICMAEICAKQTTGE